MDASISKSLFIFSWISSSDAASRVNFQEFAEAKDNFVNLLSEFSGGGQDDSLAVGRLGINKLEDTDSESCSFACSGLSLGNGVFFVDDWKNSLLLNDGGFFETER
jgi:hypothetical protein